MSKRARSRNGERVRNKETERERHKKRRIEEKAKHLKLEAFYVCMKEKNEPEVVEFEEMYASRYIEKPALEEEAPQIVSRPKSKNV